MSKTRIKSKSKPSKQRPVIVKQWDDVVYGVQHRMVVCKLEDFIAYIGREFGSILTINPKTAGETVTFHTAENLVVNYWFKQGLDLKSLEGQALIVHEALHGVDHVMQAKEIPMCYETSEPRAYYLDTVFSAINHMLDHKSRVIRGKRRRHD